MGTNACFHCPQHKQVRFLFSVCGAHLYLCTEWSSGPHGSSCQGVVGLQWYQVHICSILTRFKYELDQWLWIVHMPWLQTSMIVCVPGCSFFMPSCRSGSWQHYTVLQYWAGTADSCLILHSELRAASYQGWLPLLHMYWTFLLFLLQWPFLLLVIGVYRSYSEVVDF